MAEGTLHSDFQNGDPLYVLADSAMQAEIAAASVVEYSPQYDSRPSNELQELIHTFTPGLQIGAKPFLERARCYTL
jgi:hypothetical protein